MKSNYYGNQKVLMVALICASFLGGGQMAYAAGSSPSIQDVQQNIQVKGTVVDAKGETVVGASVVVKGTTNGAVTNIDGDFVLNCNSGATLEISYIGYVSTTVKAAPDVRVTLVEDNEALEEVVVVGYGVQKKSDVTGAMSRMTSAQIEDRPVQNALQAMQGKVTGVEITSNNRPGEIGDIRIRGNRSINADNTPLYVIDGIPMSAGSIADINPNDIESMEILKDASATAIYGSRGANGVILIQTKKGEVGKTTIRYDGSFSWSKLNAMTDYMDAGELLDYRRNAAITGGTYTGKYGSAPDPDADRSMFLGTQSYMDASVAKAYQYDSNGNIVMRAATAEEKALGYADQVPVYDASKLPTTDWGDLVSQVAFTQNHQLSLSAGNEKSKLYLSLNYLDQEVPMKDQNYKRYSANVNGEVSPTKWVTAGLGINASHSIKNYGVVSNFSNTVAKDSYGLAMNLMPWTPAYNEDGSILISNEGDAEHNVLRNINSATNETRYYGANLSSYAEINFGEIYSPLKGLKWRTNFGVQFRNSREGSYYGEEWTNPYGYSSTAPNVAYNSQRTNLSWTLENLIFYNKTIGGIHNFNVTLMQSAEQFRTESINMRAYEVVYPTSMWYDMGNSNKDELTFGTGYSTWSRASYMARLNYSLMDKYLLTVTGRRDGASVLAQGNKWDFFPSAALAWRMEQEEFVKNVAWINQLKLRAGYGVTGNSSVSAYQTSGSCTSTYANIPFGIGSTSNTTGTKTDVMPNLNLGWEKTASTNIGLDFGFLDSRIGGSIEYYIANTSDLIMNKSLPVITGYALVQSNIGRSQNKGFELSLSTVNIKSKNFEWQTDWTFSTNTEKIKELANGADRDTSGPWFVDNPINVYWDYKYDRIWQNTNEDLRQIALYSKIGKINFLPGQYKVCDQSLVEVAEGTDGATSTTITYTDATGSSQTETVTYLNNGFGTFDNDDKIIYNKSPKWTGGLNNSFTYKNWNFSFFTYFRFGNTYYGLTQTVGRRVENDVWSPDNTDAKFAQPTTATRTSTYDYVRNYTKGNMILVRNISLSYTLPQNILKRFGASSAQVYAQVLNPFLFGGELVKSGINPDDITGWDASNHIGGQTNNTCITRSGVLGVRLSF